MNRYPLILLLASLTGLGCRPEATATKHLFYLHGRIVAEQGVEAVSERFGPYEYRAILAALGSTGAQLHAEVRTPTTDFGAFCAKVSGQIDSLISAGVAPADITVVGASQGALMAMQVSDMNRQPINYVLLGASNPAIAAENDWALHGRVLGIYETSDQIAGGNYDHWVANSPEAITFEQLQLNTGLGHGFIYRPMPEWVEPAKNWIK